MPWDFFVCKKKPITGVIGDTCTFTLGIYRERGLVLDDGQMTDGSPHTSGFLRERGPEKPKLSVCLSPLTPQESTEKEGLAAMGSSSGGGPLTPLISQEQSRGR